MSFMNALQDFIFGQGISYSDHMSMGAHYTLGANVIETPNGSPRGAGAWTRLETPTGGRYNFHHMRGSTAGGYTAAPVGAKMSGMGMFGIGTTLAMTGLGFYQGGFQGGMESIMQDVAISGAVARYGHEMRSYAGAAPAVSYGNLGMLKGAYENLSIMGRVGGVMAQGMSVASYGSRTFGAVVGSTALSMVTGGGALGFAGQGAAAALGAKFSPFITGGAMIAGGAYLAGRGAYSIMKMGYDYRQSQKSIHTSGDLTAFNTGAAMTMRARSVQAMQNSHMNSRSALGQEAMFLHNPQRSYHAPTRAGY